MKLATNDEKRLISYLLGELSEDEQEQIEVGYFADQEQFQQLIVVEDELIDAYVREQLSPAEKQQFESYFLRSTERRERVEFARAWLRFIEKKSLNTIKPAVITTSRAPARNGWLVAAAVLIVMLAGGIWLSGEMARLRGQLQESEQARGKLEQQQTTLAQQVTEQQTRNDQLTQELQNARNGQQNPDRNPEIGKPTPVPSIASFILKPIVVRGSGTTNRLALPANTEWVRLQVTLGEGVYPDYRATITNVPGVELWRQSGLKAQGKGTAKTITVKLPVDVFTESDLILTISGIGANGEVAELADYPFAISIRK